MYSLRMLCYFTVATITMFASSPAHSATPADHSKTIPRSQSLQSLESPMARDHTSSKVVFTISNFGMFGEIQYPLVPNPGEYHPGCEYPKNSGIQHCYQGALWIGAVVGNDTLVSVGLDGWQNVREMFPDAGPGEITRLSNRQGDADFDATAIADEEFIAVFYDTLVESRDYTGPDPFENRRAYSAGLEDSATFVFVWRAAG